MRSRWAIRWEGMRFRAASRVALRVASGSDGRLRGVPRRIVAAAGADVDEDAGVAVVRVHWRPRSARAGREYVELLERIDGEWRSRGGGGGPLDTGLGEVEMLEVGGGAGVRSFTGGHGDSERPFGPARWIASNTVRVGPDVARVLVGDRGLDVPRNRELTVVWTSPYHSQGGTRPVVVALGRDGAELSRIGPGDALDTYTWRRLREEGAADG